MSANVTRAKNPQPAWEPLRHTSGIAMTLTIRPDAKDDDVKHLLAAKLVHLEAMLVATYGCNGEEFRCWNEALQDNFMWACAEIASECRAILDVLSSRRGPA